jgi:septal ring factor EnvC (AmiA/AmiB activator)
MKIQFLKPFVRKVAWLMCFAAIFATAPSFAQDVSEAEAKAKLQELQKTITDMQKELEAVKTNRNKLLLDLQGNETEINELQDKIDDIKTQLGTQQQSLRQLQESKGVLLAEQRAQKKHVAQQVKAVYQLGRQSNFKLLLNQDGPEKVARVLKYYDYFLAARTDQLTRYQNNLDELAKIEPEILRTTDALQRNQNTLQQRSQQLQDKQQQRKQTLAMLEKTISSKDLQLEKLSEDRRAIEKVLARVATLISDLPFKRGDQPFAQSRGRLSWPTKGKIAHSFGSYRVADKLKWDGVLISAQEGSEVRAIHHGRVVVADYLRGQGLLMIIDHGGGYLSIYAHNRSLHRQAGDWVEAGELIASVGNSGGQSDNGLYFEIRQNGKPVNPASWCA